MLIVVGMEQHVQSVIFPRVLEEKMRTLKRKFEDLESKTEDMEEELAVAEISSRKKRRKQVKTWIEQVESLKNRIQQAEQEVTESNLFTRAPLVRSVEKLTTEVTEHAEMGGEFPNGLTLEVYEKKGDALLTGILVGEK